MNLVIIFNQIYDKFVMFTIQNPKNFMNLILNLMKNSFYL